MTDPRREIPIREPEDSDPFWPHDFDEPEEDEDD